VTTEPEFAAHVAHQINNPLTVVIANLDVAIVEVTALAQSLESCVSIEERLRDARAAAERLHRTVSELARNGPVPAWTPSERAPESTESAAPCRRGRVLVVDDERLIAAALQRTLASEHEVTALSRAREALEGLIAGQRFDLILCDLMMPEMTGIEFHAELSSLAPDQAARMVFLTGGPCTPFAKEFLAKVPNLHIEKPFDTRRLRALVSTHMRSYDAVVS
jgi:CheY-like chemotaxis protein